MALDRTLRESFDALATLAIERGLADLMSQFQTVDRQAAARGMLGSGNRLVQLDQAAVSVLNISAEGLLRALEDMLRVLRGDAAVAAVDEVLAMLDSRFQELARKVAVTRDAKLEEAAKGLMRDWRGALSALGGATPQVGQELAVRARLAVMVAAASGGHNVVQHQTFNAPVGAVQTGKGAVANVVQQATMPEVAVLLRALQEVRDAMTAAASISEAKRSEALEVLQELETQAKRSKPNALSVSGLLSGLGGVTEALANAPQAWATLCMWGTALASAVS